MPPQMTRLMIIFGLLIALFVIMRWVSKPESFYWYGHYRGAALAEISSLPIVHSDPAACGDCHIEQAGEKQQGPHRNISCQTCHGAGEAHVQDPTTDNIILPPVQQTCLTCHKKNYARPADFPQIVVAGHSEGMSCDDCHIVHNPGEFQ